VPQNNDFTYCPTNSSSCYLYKSTYGTYASTVGYCQAAGGYVVAWNSDPEQLDVERYFLATANLPEYWIGMFKAGTLYYWTDGGFIGSLIPKRANPYVHVGGAGQCAAPPLPGCSRQHGLQADATTTHPALTVRNRSVADHLAIPGPAGRQPHLQLLNSLQH
jgi:hypothetical protein